jgi:uncharacterized membrane protein (DUF4010 family)
MSERELLLRLGLALAIGLLVGVERHWREREALPGSRTAGVRTFGLSGLLGGIAGLCARTEAVGGGLGGALLVSGVLLAFASGMILFKLHEAITDETTSVTTVVAAILVFMLGVSAVLGDRVVAAAAGVAATALLASREMLHGLMRRLTWIELRSALVILAMSFIILPLVPPTPIGPFGGIDFASVWMLAIMIAAVSYVGYVASKLIGPSQGLLVAGALGGLASSTAVTLTMARQSAQAPAPSAAPAAAAMTASAVAVLRIGGLALALRPDLVFALTPALALMALCFGACAAAVALRQSTAPDIAAHLTNPFDLRMILRFTVLITLASYLVKAWLLVAAPASLVPMALLAGLADADAVILSLARSDAPSRLLPSAIIAAISADVAAKAAYAAWIGTRAFAMAYAAAALAAIGCGVAGLLVAISLAAL